MEQMASAVPTEWVGLMEDDGSRPPSTMIVIGRPATWSR